MIAKVELTIEPKDEELSPREFKRKMLKMAMELHIKFMKYTELLYEENKVNEGS